MARVAEPTDQRIYFKLDRFERADDHRLSVCGRWYGVRGRRFVRPTLSLRTDRGRWRALAELEHKPWAAEDGQLWRADFRLDGDATDELLEAELAVAPDIEVTLPVAGGDGVVAHAGEAAARVPARGGRPELDRLRDELTRTRAQVERLSAELVDVAGERDAAAQQADGAAARADAAAVERDQAAAERDRAIEELDRVVPERDRAVAERDRAVAERDELRLADERVQTELARVQAELSRTLAQRDQAVSGRDRARGERDQAQALLERLRGERDWAQRAATEAAQLRDVALGDLDAAHRAREEAVAERAALAERLATLQNEHDQLSSAHGAVLVMHNSTVAHRRPTGWIARTAAIAILIVVALVVALVTHLL